MATAAEENLEDQLRLSLVLGHMNTGLRTVLKSRRLRPTEAWRLRKRMVLGIATKRR